MIISIIVTESQSNKLNFTIYYIFHRIYHNLLYILLYFVPEASGLHTYEHYVFFLTKTISLSPLKITLIHSLP